MERDPMIRQTAIARVLEADRPSDAAHLPDAREICFPDVIASVTLDCRLPKGRIGIGVDASVAREIAEVIFVKDHPVVFKSQSPVQLRVRRHLLLIHPSVLDEFGDLLQQRVSGVDVAFVQLEVRLHGLVGNSMEPA